MDEKKILIGIPSMREDEVFFSSIFKLGQELKGKYIITVLVEKWQDLATAQNKIANYFLCNDFDYLLFLDDDVYGHTADMVDALVKGDAPVVSMQAYQRYHPYNSLLIKDGQGVEKDKGYGTIDLTGFQMLLLRREAFDKLGEPYFVAQYDGVNSWATDQVFFLRLKLANVKVLGCWDFCLDHAGITKDNIEKIRDDNAPTYIDRFLAAMQKREK